MRLRERSARLVFRLRLQALLMAGLRRRAMGWVEQHLRGAVDDVHALATLAHLQAADGQPGEAEASLQRLLQLQPDNARAWFNLGFLLEQQGRGASAEQAFLRAIENEPKMDQAWYGLAMSLIAQQRWADAEGALQRTNTLQPFSPFGWVQLARLHMRCQRPDRAREVIEHLRGFEPRVADRLAQETGLSVPLPVDVGQGVTP